MMKEVVKGKVLGFICFLAALIAVVPSAYSVTTERVSISSAGIQGNDWSTGSSISADGRFVAFESGARNLVPGDTNGTWDIFLHDRVTHITERVSVSSAGIQGNGPSSMPYISDDARFVAFYSLASNLVVGDTNGAFDSFIYDRVTKITERVSVSSAGIQGNGGSFVGSISANGRFVVFSSSASNIVPDDTNGVDDVFVHDRLNKITERVSIDNVGTQGNSSSSGPTISADGQFVAFYSSASNLVTGDTNGRDDVFVHDRLNKITERVSLSSAGIQGNGNNWGSFVSADGRFIAFTSIASNLVAGDTNGKQDIFVHDRVTKITERVSVSSAGIQGNGPSATDSISADGRFVAFGSIASNLISGDTNWSEDVFIHDRVTKKTERVSVSSAGIQGNGESRSPSINANGQFVVFYSLASNFVPGDTNELPDIFVRDRGIQNQSPIASAGADQTAHVGSAVTLEGSGSFDPDGNVPLTYEWSFVSMPGGSTTSLSDIRIVNPTFTPDIPGDYVICLVVKDNLGSASLADTVIISTTNSTPVADSGADQSVTVIGTSVQLTGDQSYDVDGDTITYQWTFVSIPAGSSASLMSANTATPAFTADVHGDYIIQLLVSDSWSQSSPDFVTVSFENIKPIANAGTSQSVVVGDTVSLNGSGSTDTNGDPLTYMWTLSSIPDGSQSVITNPSDMATTFVPDMPGVYVLQLIVNDGFADSDPNTIQVQVVTLETMAIGSVLIVETRIAALPLNVLKNVNMQNTLLNKLNAVIANIEAGNYADALEQLQNDILVKTNGCANSGSPDNNDWIKDCASQEIIYPYVLDVISRVEELL